MLEFGMQLTAVQSNDKHLIKTIRKELVLKCPVRSFHLKVVYTMDLQFFYMTWYFIVGDGDLNIYQFFVHHVKYAYQFLYKKSYA